MASRGFWAICPSMLGLLSHNAPRVRPNSSPNGKTGVHVTLCVTQTPPLPIGQLTTARSPAPRRRYDQLTVPDRLYFTDSDEANRLIASDPMALLIGFALDQQVSVQKAFMGPLVLRERLGSLDARVLAEAELEPIF